ncbi:hypothetical protein PMAYCL1PPCAC_08375, partial [Pristionchus mayeri]
FKSRLVISFKIFDITRWCCGMHIAQNAPLRGCRKSLKLKRTTRMNHSEIGNIAFVNVLIGERFMATFTTKTETFLKSD